MLAVIVMLFYFLSLNATGKNFAFYLKVCRDSQDTAAYTVMIHVATKVWQLSLINRKVADLWALSCIGYFWKVLESLRFEEFFFISFMFWKMMERKDLFRKWSGKSHFSKIGSEKFGENGAERSFLGLADPSIFRTGILVTLLG